MTLTQAPDWEQTPVSIFWREVRKTVALGCVLRKGPTQRDCRSDSAFLSSAHLSSIPLDTCFSWGHLTRHLLPFNHLYAISVSRVTFFKINFLNKSLMCGWNDFPLHWLGGFCAQKPLFSSGWRSALLFTDGTTQPAAAASAPVAIESALLECAGEGVCAHRRLCGLLSHTWTEGSCSPLRARVFFCVKRMWVI